jgi:alkanesulfonate monooxygenase SsuD/methylene tetrahydromethanopterin reductase-like flavin-dependent oxidoreductase (luciferase family)
MSRPFHLALALDGAGWHPQSWRELEDASQLFTPEYWVGLACGADRAGLDFLTIEDSLRMQSTSRWRHDDRVDQVRGRLDAVLIAARVAPLTAGIGIIPVATTTHTEPFHISKAIASLDFVSGGRAGVQVRISPTLVEAAQFGRRELAGGPESTPVAGVSDVVEDLFDEAADFVEVVRRLWDSWEDDAEVRDVPSGRFVDRDKLHYIDFQGRWFSVRGPSITPRPPQGQPVVAVLAHVDGAFRLAARAGDVVFVTPQTSQEVRTLVGTVRFHEEAVSRDGSPLRIIADLVVFLGDSAQEAQARKQRLDDLDGRALRSDASIFVGSSSELVEQLFAWHAAGIDGFRLRPGDIPNDFEAIVREVAPLTGGTPSAELGDGTLRARLGLGLPSNRYVVA